MTAKEIVKKYLEEYGYDGLYGDECGCLKDDLSPCCEFMEDCKPGYRRDCKECADKLDCEIEYGGEPGGWCIGEDKP